MLLEHSVFMICACEGVFPLHVCEGVFPHCVGGHVTKSTLETNSMAGHRCTGLKQMRWSNWCHVV